MKHLLIGLLLANHTFAANVDYRSKAKLDPSDYLYGSRGKLKDSIFDQTSAIDLSLNIGVTSDCGKINVVNTLQATMKNILDSKYIEKMGQDIVGASPMLLLCYMSPTWCAIVKQAQLRANMLAQLRFDQCSAINKYTDQRVSDFYEERSKCSSKAIDSSKGNFEEAMEQCKNYEDYGMTSWAGGGSADENSLISSTAKWAGFSGKDAERMIDLTKAFVGDSVLKKGSLSVDYGPRRVQLTPRTYLMEVKSSIYEKLCEGLIPAIIRRGGIKSNIYSVVSDAEIRAVTSEGPPIDRQTLLSLVYLPFAKRQLACRKLSEAIALGKYTEDMGQTLDFLSSKLLTNPHLPQKRSIEADNKRRALKDQVELTMAFEKNHTEPLNDVLYQINKEGAKYLETSSKRQIHEINTGHHNQRMNAIFFDCADGIGC